MGAGVAVTLPYERIGVTGASGGMPDPAGPTHDLLWADGEGLTWAAGTIIDWPVIDP